MKFLLIACFFFSTFSKSLDDANQELRRTNKVLLQALRELAVGEDSATSAGTRTEKMVASMEEECWKESSDGVDLKRGEWDGSGGTGFEQCKENAKNAGVQYFAWTGEVYQPGYCKVLKPSVRRPNLNTNQGYGYKLWENTCSSQGDLEYACQMYYMSEDCTGPVIYMASKKYDGCQPYLFEEDALGYYFDMMVGGHCSDNTCTDCKVAAEPITKDLLVGGKTPTCRSRKYLGLSDEACPTWNFAFGPCPNMCAQFYALHAGCEPSYDGDLSCEPTQQEIDYAPQCFSHVLSDD